MKKILLILLTVGLFTTACNDFLEVEPVSDVSGEIFWKSEQHLLGGIRGVYDAYQGIFIEKKGKYWDWGEGRSDNFFPRSDAYYVKSLTNNTLAADGGYGTFEALYTIIARANTFLANYDKVEGISEEKINNYVGQVLALRAVAYFHAVKVWGDVPLITEAYTSVDDDIYPEREDKEKIYTELIIPDLIKATTLLSKSAGNQYINYYGASAFLMDIYMWRHQYNEAIATFANFGNNYSLLPGSKWSELFTNSSSSAASKENIFVVEWNYLTDGYSYMFGSFYYGDPSYRISDKWVDAVTSEENDLRLWNTIDTTFDVWSGHTNWKFLGVDAPAEEYTREREFPVPVYRWADILTLHSEALAQTSGVTEEALVGLNKVRVRAGLLPKTVADFANKDELIELILKDRQVEFVQEGKRWYDLVRTERVEEVMNPIYDNPLQPGELLWPIDEKDIAENPNITQNEAYK